jgi:DNA mismatch repair protein MutH
MKIAGKKFQTVTKNIAGAPVNFTGQAKQKTFVIIAVLVKFEGIKARTITNVRYLQ